MSLGLCQNYTLSLAVVFAKWIDWKTIVYCSFVCKYFLEQIAEQGVENIFGRQYWQKNSWWIKLAKSNLIFEILFSTIIFFVFQLDSFEQLLWRSCNNIRDELEGQRTYVSFDETTDCLGRYMTNILIGKFSSTDQLLSFLVKVSYLERINSGTIARHITFLMG